MKAKIFALAALVLGLASCQNDFDGANVGVGGEVDFQLAVSAPEFGATRADADGSNGHDSAFGAIDYLSQAEWDEVDLRYTLEVYDYDPATKTIGDAPVKDRMVKVLDKYEPVVFDLRLVPNRHYHFVVFADFVVEDATDVPTVAAQATIGKHHIIGDTLAEITLKDDAINNELTDAYFATAQFEIKNSAAKDMILRRPYGKVRVVATDLHELNLNVEATSVKVEYTAPNANAFNAVTGKISGEGATTFTAIYNDTNVYSEYTEGYDKQTTTALNGTVRKSHMTLSTDYILATDTQAPIHFTVTVYDGEQIIKETAFSTDIPVQRNYLTTVIGNVLTTATEINVSIDDDFYNGNNVEDKPYYQTIWDGVSIEEPTYDAATKTYTVESGAELAWIANEVNNGTTFEGKTVVLANDINLGGNEWTPIGGNGKHFTGTFDGKNFIVGDFEVTTQEGHAGLFGSVRATIKNLKVAGVKIVSHHYAGAIVGQGYVKMDNCHVDNVEITLTTKNGDWGDKAGGLVGQNCEGANMYITNSTAKNVKIQGYRDLGGIVGMAHNDNTVSGCDVENITILQDLSVNYEPTTPTTLGAVIGRKGTNVTDSNNTKGENIYVAVIVAEGLTQDTEDGTYSVTSVEGLAYIAEQVNDEGNTEIASSDIVLNGDIDLSAIASLFSATRGNASNWTPIGTSANPFTGTFDGNGCTIKNLTLVETEAKEGKAYIGFFGYAKNATIKNVTFENVYINIPCLDIDHSQGHIGAVAGSLEGTSTIENVTVKGDITVYATQTANGASRVAVVAGGNSYGDVTMKNVHVIANEGSSLIANNNTGALAGQLQGKMVFENCSSNIDVTVNKFFAGGLVGIAAGDSYFKNCHTTGDVAVVAGREGRHNDEYRVGGIAGGWADGKTKVCTLEDCSYTGNVSGKNADGAVAEPLDYMGYVGRGYTLASCAGSKVIIDGTEFVQKYDNVYGVYTINGCTPVSTADELAAALAEGEGVYLLNDITMAASKGGYSKAGILQNKAQTIDGNGHTLTVTGAGSTWDCAIYTNGGVIKNLTVKGAMRGIFTAGTKADLYIENVKFQNVIYTFNSDGGNKEYGVYVSNSVVNGWTSHSDVHKEVVYTNCSFGEGSGYKFCRPYGPTSFVDCTFCPGYTIDQSKTTEITFTNCTFEE